ncbi:MAG: MFS transporter, partial [Pseudomonadota bacterium]
MEGPPFPGLARGLWVMGLGLAAIAMANNMIIPLLGPVGRTVGLSDQHIGLVHSGAALAAIPAAPWWGRRSDLVGRRPVFVASLLGFAASTFALAWVLQYALWEPLSAGTVFALLLMSRLAYGALGSGALPAAAGYLADVSRPEDRLRAMTMPSRAFSLGGLFGLCLVWPAAALFGYAGPVFLVAGFGAMVAVASLFLIGTAPHRREGRGLPDASRQRLPAPYLLLAVNGLAFTLMSMIQTTVPFFVQDALALSTSEAISLATGLALVLTLATLAALRAAAASKLGAPSLAALGLGIAAAGAAFLHLSSGLAVLGLAHVLLGFGLGLFVPTTQSALSLRTSSATQARAAGRLSAAATSGYVLGPFAGAFLYADHGARLYLFAMAALAGLAVLLWIRR